MKPSGVSKFLWAAMGILTLFGPRDEQYIRLQMYSKLGFIVGFWSWLVKDNKSKREEKNNTFTNKTLNQKKTLNPN